MSSIALSDRQAKMARKFIVDLSNKYFHSGRYDFYDDELDTDDKANEVIKEFLSCCGFETVYGL